MIPQGEYNQLFIYVDIITGADTEVRHNYTMESVLGRPPLDGALEANKRSIVMRTKEVKYRSEEEFFSYSTARSRT